jgi:hypothetical protein
MIVLLQPVAAACRRPVLHTTMSSRPHLCRSLIWRPCHWKCLPSHLCARRSGSTPSALRILWVRAGKRWNTAAPVITITSSRPAAPPPTSAWCPAGPPGQMLQLLLRPARSCRVSSCYAMCPLLGARAPLVRLSASAHSVESTELLSPAPS